jgi:hypothetical protein
VTKIAGAYGQGRTPSSYSTTATNNMGVANSTGVFIGIVKNNKDPQNMGRCQVFIPDMGGNPEDPNNWQSVAYATPFGGSTSIFEQGGNVKEYSDTMKSYGLWFGAPDIDSHVLVAFAGGRLDKGYWFACLFQRGTQVSIPGIPAKNTHSGENIPAAPKNKKDDDADLEKYVEHKPMYDALKKQGLEKDGLRGLTSSGATRESPSKVFGLLTPGQHQFVLDDGDKDGKNKQIRLRTTNGVQLLLDDTSGHVYIITKDGENWLELSNDGQIHIYGSKDINIRSEANINLRADKSINIEAEENIRLKAGKDIAMEANENVSANAGNNTLITSGNTSNISSVSGHYETAGQIHMNGPAAEQANVLALNTLAVNQSVKESICTTVPEHEPWAAHTGEINPVGPGNQQMKEDPAPEQQPRQPEAEEQGAPVDTSKSEKAEEVPVVEAKASDEAINMIKDENGYSPVATDDAAGQSAGFGSEIPDPVENPTEDNNPLLNNIPASDIDTVQLDDEGAITKSSPGKDLLNSFGFGNSNKDNGKFAQQLSQLTQLENSFANNPILPSGSLGNTNNYNQSQIFTEGVTADRANQLLADDISRDELAVKNTLQGVDKIPKNVFDGLVSMQNQVGDVSYAYVKGEKIDLTSLYRNGAWDRAASFIAADERDRPRRIREANLMINNKYGARTDESLLVTTGLNKTDELIAKGKLNAQTGKPATSLQVQAASVSYFAQTGKLMNSLSSGAKVNVVDNLNSGKLASLIRRQAGPWPY